MRVTDADYVRFNITSPRIKASDDVFDYHKYSYAYAERMPISIDGKNVALADHCVSGCLRELVGESSDEYDYMLFFNGSLVGTVRRMEEIFGRRAEDDECTEASVMTFHTEKELLDAYDKLLTIDKRVFDDLDKAKAPKLCESGVSVFAVKTRFYNSCRKIVKGRYTYDLEKGADVLRALTDAELDDVMWWYRVTPGTQDKSELGQALQIVKRERAA